MDDNIRPCKNFTCVGHQLTVICTDDEMAKTKFINMGTLNIFYFYLIEEKYQEHLILPRLEYIMLLKLPIILSSNSFYFKGELTWKIYLCILLPKYVYLLIQCTKNMF